MSERRRANSAAAGGVVRPVLRLLSTVLRAACVTRSIALSPPLRWGTIHRIVWMYRMPRARMLLGKDDPESDVEQERRECSRDFPTP